MRGLDRQGRRDSEGKRKKRMLEPHWWALWLNIVDTVYRACLLTNTYIIYASNLGFPVVVFDREREQGRFREALRGQGGAPGEHK